ncbi:hypothetical protein chiPu_0013548 [Chiloscyllium punctatum]|uniref:Uncharacterized protein n=1 Tax=Chiloscyllium punctatum TaxID=137246 RepID=A0A401SXF5_CHIPU|nr:hypothetical protein [Chiloscyllium punctatum]
MLNAVRLRQLLRPIDADSLKAAPPTPGRRICSLKRSPSAAVPLGRYRAGWLRTTFPTCALSLYRNTAHTGAAHFSD